MMDGETHYYGCEENHKECRDARFLAEVERLTGATREEMLGVMNHDRGRSVTEHALEGWLRRILGEPK
jgi:hypothetical protein